MGRVGEKGKPEPFGHRGVFADAVCGAEDGRKISVAFAESARARVSLKTRATYGLFERRGRWFERSLSGGIKPICGALRKTGERCRSKHLLKGRRCKYHGGMSSGPKTTEGLGRTVTAMLAGLERWRIEHRRLRELGLLPPRPSRPRRKKSKPKTTVPWVAAVLARVEQSSAARRFDSGGSADLTNSAAG